MDIQERLASIGVDYAAAMHTFANNSALFERFLKRLPQDENFALLQKAYAEKNFQDMELTAHTLKGVSGNLRITPLFNCCTNLVNALREHQPQEILDRLYSNLVSTYEKTIEVLSTL